MSALVFVLFVGLSNAPSINSNIQVFYAVYLENTFQKEIKNIIIKLIIMFLRDP